MDIRLVHLGSEVQELYRKENYKEIRKWRNRKRKGLEIAKTCGIGLDYHLVDRSSRLAYDNIAQNTIKIRRLEVEILRMYAITEMLYLSGKISNAFAFGIKSTWIRLSVKDTAPKGSNPAEGQPYPSAYMTILSKNGTDIKTLKVDRNVRLNVSENMEEGMPVTRIARTLIEALEDFPLFKERFIEEVTRILNKTK